MSATPPANSPDELAHITKPGGHIVLALRPDGSENSKFTDKLVALEAESKWRLVEISEQFQPLPSQLVHSRFAS